MNKFVYKKSSEITVLSASIDDFKYKKHAHEEYALGVTLRGVQQYHLNGSFHSSYKNGVMLFNPEQPHDGMSQNKSGIDYVMIYIDPLKFCEILGTKKMPMFSSPIVYDQGLQNKILDISSTVFNDMDDALCNEKLSDLAVYLKPAISEGIRKDIVLIEKVKEIIQSNLTEIISLDKISCELGISKFQLIRIFKSTTGISPYQYFLNMKVEKAKKIIESSGDVYLAVEGCNFVDLTHLNKHFKSCYGITAYEYARSVNR